jgi:tetratricopeptide (TPR) repeat protein
VESYSLDTTFTLAAHYASLVFSYDYDFVPVVKWAKIAYRGKKRLPYYYQLWIESGRACCITKNCDSVLYYNDLLAQSDIKSRLFWLDIGYNYLSLEQNQKAVKAFEKAETISSEWGGDWKFRNYYIYFGNACHNAGIHDKEAMVYKTGLKLFPDDDSLIYGQTICAISKGDTTEETKLLTKLFKLSRDGKKSESDIEESLGDMYSGANSLDKAELHYRNALKSDQNNYKKMNSLSFFLIHYDRNVDEADSLSKKVLKIMPDSRTAIWVKGLVCYKHGQYEDALNILQQAYDKNIVWYTPLFNNIKKVKKAIANQK